MKKLFVMALASLMLVACTTTKPAEATATPEVKESAATETVASGMKLGLGTSTSLNLSDATADKEGQAQVNTTIVALGTTNDVITYIKVDVAQNAGKFDTAGVITSDKEAPTPSKVEKGADYGMAGSSEIGKEWFEQAAAFDEYVLGKTVEEVLATPTYAKDNHHTAVPEAEDLKTSVTIDIGGFLKALEVAGKNLVEVENAVNVGMANVTSLSMSDATADKEGQVQVNTNLALTATDADGKFVFSVTDVAQNTVKFDTTGVITSDKEAPTPTKLEKGADYGMAGSSEIGKEWFEQAAAFDEYVLGKTVEEVLATPTYAKDNHHTAVPEAEDLKTSVTIDIGGFLKALEASVKNAVTVE